MHHCSHQPRNNSKPVRNILLEDLGTVRAQPWHPAGLLESCRTIKKKFVFSCCGDRVWPFLKKLDIGYHTTQQFHS